MTITKLIKAYFLTVFCAVSLFAATIQSVGIVTAEELQRMTAYQFTFKGYDPNATMPADVVAALPKFGNLDMRVEADRNIFNKAVESYRSVILDFIRRCIDIPEGDTKTDLNEIIQRASSREVHNIRDVTFFIDLVRAVACISGRISDAERELFENSRSKPLFAMFQQVEKAGQHGAAWKLLSDSELEFLIEDAAGILPSVDETVVEISSGYWLPKSAKDLIAKEMRKAFPCEKFPLFIPGHTHMGITLFVRAILAELHPIALPHPNQKIPLVHGAQMTPASFSWHDSLHGEVDTHAKAPRNWAGNMIRSILYRHELRYTAVIPEVVSNAAQMYSGVKKLFGALVDAAQKRFAATASDNLPLAKQQYNQVLHSIFYLLHEVNALNDKNLYNSKTLQEFFEKLINDSKAGISDDYGEKSALSDIDMTAASDEELKDWALDNLKTESDFGVYNYPQYIMPGTAWRQAIGQREFTFSVKRGNLLSKFTIEFNDGSVLESLQESRQYILSSAEDSEWLLKAAGFSRDASIVKPDAEKATKAEFISYMADLNGRLNAMLDGLKNFYLEEVKADVAIAAAEAEYTIARAAINNLYDPVPTAESRAAAASTTVTAVGSVPTIAMPQSLETK